MIYLRLVENLLSGCDMNSSDAADLLHSLMEEIRRDIRSVDAKLDSIIDARRNEARETGEQSVRISTLEKWRERHEEEVSSTRKIAIGAVISSICAVIGFLLLVMVKMVSEHPQVIK